MSKSTIDVSVIIVSMNNIGRLFPCLDSIILRTRLSYEIIVVAYMFSEENLQELRRRFPDVKICINNEIKGFAENNNLAVNEATGEFLFIVNDDTLMEMPVIDLLIDDFRKLPENTAIVSPATYYMDGSLQSCGRPKHTIYTYLLFLFGLWKEQKVRSKFVNQKGLFRTYDIVGAAFLIKGKLFRKAGGFNEEFFFCPEDIALSTKLNKMGYLVYADSDIKILHLENGTASMMKTATLPAAFKGEVIYYSNNSTLLYCLVSIFIILRCMIKGICFYLKFLFIKNDKYKIEYLSNFNVIQAVLKKASPKEIFMFYYNKLRSNE